MEDGGEQSRVCDIPGVAHMARPALLVTTPLQLVLTPSIGRDDWRSVRYPGLHQARMQARRIG